MRNGFYRFPIPLLFWLSLLLKKSRWNVLNTILLTAPVLFLKLKSAFFLKLNFITTEMQRQRNFNSYIYGLCTYWRKSSSDLIFQNRLWFSSFSWIGDDVASIKCLFWCVQTHKLISLIFAVTVTFLNW